NQHVTLLTDIRTVFDRFKRDRLRTKAELIPALRGSKTTCGANGPAWTARPRRTCCRKVILAACCAPSASDRRRFGRRDGVRTPSPTPGTIVRNSRQHGPAIANQAPHRHRQAKLGACRGREPPHARHTCLGQPTADQGCERGNRLDAPAYPAIYT